MVSYSNSKSQVISLFSSISTKYVDLTRTKSVGRTSERFQFYPDPKTPFDVAFLIKTSKSACGAKGVVVDLFQARGF